MHLLHRTSDGTVRSSARNGRSQFHSISSPTKDRAVTDAVLQQAIVDLGLVTDRDRLVSRSGGRLDWLIDLRPVFLNADHLRRIAARFWGLFRDREPRQIGGMETAAIPLLTALLLAAPAGQHRDGLIIRKERKTTGRGNRIEGRPSGLPVLLVDDVLNSGSSAELARVAIEAGGGTVAELFVVIDYRSRKGLAWRERHGIAVTSLFVLDDFKLSLRRDPLPLLQNYRMVWRREVAGANPFYVVPKSAPVLDGGLIYRGCDAARMDAFDTATGEIVWSLAVPGAAARKGIWSTPAVHAGRVYFGAYDGTMYCLDAATGQEVWAEPLGEWIGASPLVVPRYGMLYVGIEYERPWAKGSMTALDLATGEKRWEHRTVRYQHGSAASFAARDLVIWGSADHETLAFEAGTGTIAWRFPTGRSVKYAPAVDEGLGLVAFASFDRFIYLLDAATGRELGRWETGGLCYTTPLFARGKLFCGSGDRKLYVIDVATRTLIKTIDAGARVYASPVLVGDSVLFGTNGGKVLEIDADSLAVVGAFQLSDAVTNAVAASPDGRRLYVSTAMNALVCVERLDVAPDGPAGDRRTDTDLAPARAAAHVTR